MRKFQSFTNKKKDKDLPVIINNSLIPHANTLTCLGVIKMRKKQVYPNRHQYGDTVRRNYINKQYNVDVI